MTIIRRGASLLELLVAMLIVAILIGLLLGAIQKVRRSATRLQSMNNLKQLSLATASFIESQNKLPSGNDRGQGFDKSLFISLLPYIEQGAYYERFKLKNTNNRISDNFAVKVYFSPADPSLSNRNAESMSACSYPANGVVFLGRSNRSPQNITDGLSSTILYAERYAMQCSHDKYAVLWIDDIDVIMPTHDGKISLHGASIAASNTGDAYPIITGSPAVSRSSIPGLTFQLSPIFSECDTRIAQSPHASGMLVALADGSVRVLAPGMEETAYYGLLTYNQGDTAGLTE